MRIWLRLSQGRTPRCYIVCVRRTYLDISGRGEEAP